MSANPDRASGIGRIHAGLDAWERGEFDEAVRLTTDAIDSGTLSSDVLALAYYSRGLAHSRKGGYRQALQDFSDSLRLNPTFVHAYYQRGYVYRQCGQDDDAIGDYDRVIALDPGFMHAYINRGVIYIDKGLYQRALQDFHRAIRLDPKQARAYSDRGCAFYGNGQYGRAMEDFDRALRIDPSYAIAHLHRGHVYCMRGRHSQALEEYTQAITLNPEFALAYKNRGHMHFHQGSFADAAADYQRYLAYQLDDASIVILLYLARVRAGVEGHAELSERARDLDLGRWPGAAVAMLLGDLDPEHVLAQASDDPDLEEHDGRHLGYFYIAQHYLLQRKLPQAVEMLRLALLEGATDCFEYALVEAELRRLGVAVLWPRAER